MIESTARAERVSPELSSRSGYTWEVPQKPVSVCLPFETIERLERMVIESFRSLTSRGSEIGGVLLGRIAPGSPSVVSVEDFELISCDYSRGPLYRLSDADMGRFERAIEQHNGASGPRAVGYFRSHTRKGLSLDPDDLLFLDARFRDANHIALLVRPFATKASTAGIFIRENGAIHTESSYLEFPFRSSQLTASSGSAKTESNGAAVAEPPAGIVTPPPVSPVAAKPAIRGQIVPIASRREIAMPEPISGAAPAIQSSEPAVLPAVLPAPAPAPAPQPSAELAVREEKPIVRRSEPVAVAATPAKAPKEVEKAPEEAKPADTPSARRGSKLIPAVAVLAIAAIAGAGYLLYPGFHKSSRVPASTADATPLNLRVEHSGPDLLLTWNRDAAGIRNAVHAVLSISDGERHENYDMDPGQLANGSIVYSPLTPDVSFRLEVTGQNQAKIASESVRVLRTRPSPMDDPKSPASSKPAPPATPAKTTPSSEPTAAPANQAPADDTAQEKPTALVSPTRPFDSSSLAKRLRPATSTELTDAPAAGGAEASPQASMPGGNFGAMAPPPPPKQAAPPPAPAPKAAGGQISLAVLMFRKEPEYPKIAQQMGVKGTVELVATIGSDGRVKGVKVVKGPGMLQKSAQDAVMQWVYKPALLNGVPVENESRISINFSSGK